MGLLSKLLGTISGNNDLKVSEQLLFDKVIGFRNIVPGCGASTFVQNMAVALSEKTRFNVCVLDTNFLYPIQYPLLSNGDVPDKGIDILDFSGDLSAVVRNTSYNNVYIAQLEKRTVIDMLSGKDTEMCITKFMATLKSYFDVILVDISNELTNTAIHAAIKCNKIYQIGDTSLKCLYYIKKSMNTMVTMGVPVAKANKVIINRVLDDIVLDLDSTMKEAGLEIIAKVPLSYDIAVFGASGKKLYGALSSASGISAFNVAIEAILNDLLEKTPLNSDYMDISQELNKIQEELQQKHKKPSGDIIEEISGDFVVEETVENLDTSEVLEEVIEEPKSSLDLSKKEE